MKKLNKKDKAKAFALKETNTPKITPQDKDTFKKRQTLQELCQEITQDNLNIFIEWDKSSMRKEFNF